MIEEKIPNAPATTTSFQLNAKTFRSADAFHPPRMTTTPYFLDEPRTKPLRVNAQDITSNVIADCIVEFCLEHGDLISNLKLQKLLYYSQAWYLAINIKPLFKDKIQAWVNGPVQPDVLARYSPCKHGPIAEAKETWIVSKKIHDHIADVMIAYGKLSAYDLERLSCEETPWLNARKLNNLSGHLGPEISQKSMREFYKARLNEQKA